MAKFAVRLGLFATLLFIVLSFVTSGRPSGSAAIGQTQRDCDPQAGQGPRNQRSNCDTVRVGVHVGARNTGCFAQGTSLRLADGSYKTIEALSGEDQIWNPITGRAYSIVRMVAGPEREPLVRIRTKTRAIGVTVNHPLATPRGYVSALSLRPGDLIRLGDGFESVLEVERVTTEDNVWNLALAAPDDSPEHHAVEANGFVSGDLDIQERLERTPERLIEWWQAEAAQ